ncbi:hypothetical protein Tco_0745380 [Tanacetum coccineum]
MEMLSKFPQTVNRLYAFIYETNHSKSGLGLPSIVALGRSEKVFYTGLKKFIEHCKPLVNSFGNIKYPCKSCRNVSWVAIKNLSTQGDIGETSNELTQAICNEFEELYASVNEELYPGCDYVTRLDFMAKFTHFKVKGKLTDSIFNEMLEFFQFVFPPSKGYKLPPSYYAIKKTFKTIRLGYESIHACVNDCFLFWGEDNKDKQFFLVCNTSRWKDNNTTGKKVPKKVLRYFPIIPRLQRLYKSSYTAKEMTWHATGKCTEPGKMQHPIDGRAWKKFDTSNLSQSYNMWPVILTTYNLPPWLCMKESYLMLTLFISGTKSLGKDTDVYLRLLIDDLKDLWALKGVETIDIATRHKFNMGAMVYGPSMIFLLEVVCLGGVGKANMVKAQRQVIDILCNLELIYPPAFFDIMIHLDIHLTLEAHEGGPILPCPEIDTYQAKFKSEFPNQDMKEEFPG